MQQSRLFSRTTPSLEIQNIQEAGRGMGSNYAGTYYVVYPLILGQSRIKQEIGWPGQHTKSADVLFIEQ